MLDAAVSPNNDPFQPKFRRQQKDKTNPRK